MKKEILEKIEEGYTFFSFLGEEEEELEALEEQMFLEDAECFLELNEEELQELKEEFEMSDEEFSELAESIRKRVSSKGVVKKVRSRDVRSRRATMTTGMSRTKLKQRARRAALTRKRNISGVRKAVKKRQRAMRKRKQMGIR